MVEAKVKSELDLTPLLLTRPQVAGLLQVSEDTVDNLHRVKQLCAIKCGKHRRWRFPDVTAYIEALMPGEDA